MLEAAQTSADRASAASRPASQRSRVTNGSKLVAGLDGRTAEARRYRDLQLSYADDAGGAASLTQAQRALVAQAADLTVQAELLRSAMLNGEDVDLERQTAVCNALIKTLTRLGIKKASPKRPTLLDRFAEKAAARP
jgi:hypothetical protein